MKAHATHGFTLVELLVAAALSAVLVAGAFAVMQVATTGYQRMTRREVLTGEAQLAIKALRDDFSRVVCREYLSVGVDHAEPGGSSLGMLRLMPRSSQTEAQAIGDLCAVRYYVKDLSFGERTMRCLMRGVSESADTFDALKHGACGELWQPGMADEAVAYGVLAFALRPLQRGDDGAWQTWSKEQEGAPEAVEIVLVLASPEWAMRLETREQWAAAANAASTKEKGERDTKRHCFVQRIGCDEED